MYLSGFIAIACFHNWTARTSPSPFLTFFFFFALIDFSLGPAVMVGNQMKHRIIIEKCQQYMSLNGPSEAGFNWAQAPWTSSSPKQWRLDSKSRPAEGSSPIMDSAQ